MKQDIRPFKNIKPGYTFEYEGRRWIKTYTWRFTFGKTNCYECGEPLVRNDIKFTKETSKRLPGITPVNVLYTGWGYHGIDYPSDSIQAEIWAVVCVPTQRWFLYDHIVGKGSGERRSTNFYSIEKGIITKQPQFDSIQDDFDKYHSCIDEAFQFELLDSVYDPSPDEVNSALNYWFGKLDCYNSHEVKPPQANYDDLIRIDLDHYKVTRFVPWQWWSLSGSKLLDTFKSRYKS